MEARRVFTESLVSLIVLSVIFSALVFILIDPLCRMLGATESTFPYVKSYLLTIAPFIFSFIISYNLELLLATDGFPELATIYVLFGVILNIILDWYTIFKLNWGIVGAGLATSFSQTVVIVIYLIHFAGKRTTLRFTKFKFRRGLMLREFMSGIPSGITEMSPGIVTFIFNRFIVAFMHDRELIIYSILSYVILLATVLANGIAQGAQPLVSYYHGRQERKTFHTIFRYEIKSGLILAVVEAFIILVLGKHIAMLFVDDRDGLVAEIIHSLKLIAIAFPMLSMNVIITGYLTALERSRVAVLISLMRCTLTLVAALAIIATLLGISSVWLSLAVSETTCLGAAVLLYSKTRKVAVAETFDDM